MTVSDLGRPKIQERKREKGERKARGREGEEAKKKVGSREKDGLKSECRGERKANIQVVMSSTLPLQYLSARKTYIAK